MRHSLIYARDTSVQGEEVPMFPLVGIGVGLALIAPAVLHVLRDVPRIHILGTPWTPLPLYAISGYVGQPRR
jgi:hypothetical protein